MIKRWLIGAGLAALGAGAAASALLGPLVFNVLKLHVSKGMENQAVGGDIVSLGIVAPVAVAAGVLWMRRHALAPALALAPSLYAVYYAITYVLGVDYTRYPGNSEKFAPLYLGMIVVGGAIAVAAWNELSRQELPEPGPGLRRLTGWVVGALSALIGLAWLSSLAGVITGSNVTQEYLADPSMFWTIRLLDTGFVIPAGIATGVGLLLRRRFATKAAYALIGFLTCEIGAVAGMAAVLQWRGDPAASVPFLVLSLAGTLALATLSTGWVLLFRHRPERPERARLAQRAV